MAYSGGVDSSLLAFAAHAVLGERCKAVFAISDMCPEDEITNARGVAAELGLTLLEVDTYELADPQFSANTPDRCYHCKSELFSLLARVAEVQGLEYVADGANADDARDYRPGTRAAEENGVVSPLKETGMTKSDIRQLAHELGLPNWDRPSMACLASRFPYGVRITDAGLERVATSERALRQMGFRQFRVRSHNEIARVEVSSEELDRAFEHRARIDSALKEAGFPYVTLDLQGYRTGSMNETLDLSTTATRTA